MKRYRDCACGPSSDAVFAQAEWISGSLSKSISHGLSEGQKRKSSETPNLGTTHFPLTTPIDTATPMPL